MNRDGLKTAVIERKPVGGTYVDVGCIEAKAPVASAHVAHMAIRGADFGVTIEGPVGVDMDQHANSPRRRMADEGCALQPVGRQGKIPNGLQFVPVSHCPVPASWIRPEWKNVMPGTTPNLES